MGNYFNYSSKGNIVEITVKDESGAKLDTFKFVYHDTKTKDYVLKTLKRKYGFDFTISSKDKDMTWIKANEDFY